LFKLLSKYRPESRIEKRKRLLSVAEAKKENKEDAQAQKKPLSVSYGVNNVTSLIEDKKAKLVVIAHDVDPIEVTCFVSCGSRCVSLVTTVACCVASHIVPQDGHPLLHRKRKGQIGSSGPPKDCHSFGSHQHQSTGTS
jgi:ribosomal protein L7Ae-like RNA K-turn-binding protein